MTAYTWTHWCRTQRNAPPNAFQGGTDKDGSQIFIGKAPHSGDWIPAKVIPRNQVAYVAHAGREHPVNNNIQVLCGPNRAFSWQSTSGGNVPSRAIPGGNTNSGETLYIGRVWHDGAQTIGKIHPSHRACYIPYGGQELTFSNYEILLNNS